MLALLSFLDCKRMHQAKVMQTTSEEMAYQTQPVHTLPFLNLRLSCSVIIVHHVNYMYVLTNLLGGCAVVGSIKPLPPPPPPGFLGLVVQYQCGRSKQFSSNELQGFP